MQVWLCALSTTTMAYWHVWTMLKISGHAPSGNSSSLLLVPNWTPAPLAALTPWIQRAEDEVWRRKQKARVSPRRWSTFRPITLLSAKLFAFCSPLSNPGSKKRNTNGGECHGSHVLCSSFHCCVLHRKENTIDWLIDWLFWKYVGIQSQEWLEQRPMLQKWLVGGRFLKGSGYFPIGVSEILQAY